MFKKYKWNFVSVVLLVSVIGFIIFDIFLYYSIKDYLFHETFNEMRMKAKLAAFILEQRQSISIKENSEDLWRLTYHLKDILDSRVTIIDISGKVLTDSHLSKSGVSRMDNHLNRPEVKQAIQTGWGQSYRQSDTINQKLFYTAFKIQYNGKKVGFLRLAYNAQGFAASMKKILSLIGIANFVGLIILFFATLYLGTIVTYPVLKVVRTAQKIADGDFNRSFPVNRKDEVGTLNRILNQLTERLKNQISQVSYERSKLQNIITNLNVGIIAVDKNGYILNYNSALFNILRTEPRELHGKRLNETIKWKPILNAVAGSLTNRCQENGEFYYYHSNTKRFLSYIISPFYISENEDAGVLIQLQDVSELKQLEAIRKNFVASASHELKTPLTVIIGYTETLLEGAVRSPDASLRFIRRINEQAKRLEYLVSDLLKLSQLEHDLPLEVQKIDLIPFIQSILDGFKEKAEQKNLKLSIETQERNVAVKADKELIRTVLENLIDNGIKYTNEKGKVTVKVYRVNEQKVMIEVNDTGIGIDAKYQERIFQRFYRVDKSRSSEVSGTGLGLAIVKHIIERHNSKIRVASKPGKGSRFYFELDSA